jgi:hypothetical protein
MAPLEQPLSISGERSARRCSARGELKAYKFCTPDDISFCRRVKGDNRLEKDIFLNDYYQIAETALAGVM